MGRLERQNRTGDRRRRAASGGRSRWSWRARARRSALNYQSNEAKAQEVADEIAKFGGTCVLAKADVADPQGGTRDGQAGRRQFGHLDILVNNAGITRDKMLAQDDRRGLAGGDPDQPQRGVLLHLGRHPDHDRAELRADHQHQLDERPGRRFGQANYSASKGGIIAFTRTAALELAKSNITVNVVAPGFTETDMFAKVPAERADPDQGQDPAGPLRPAGGDRQGGDLPGRRRRLHHRAADQRQRRRVHVTSAWPGRYGSARQIRAAQLSLPASIFSAAHAAEPPCRIHTDKSERNSDEPEN